MTSTINKFSHIFTQNQESIDLLKKINYSNFSLSGIQDLTGLVTNL